MPRRVAAVSLAAALLASSAPAVIIDSGDGTGNTSAPSHDPGFDNVGLRGGLSAVYLGNGWVLTANHVGAGDVDFGGQPYELVPNSAWRLRNGDGTFADLLLFGISPVPNLPSLEIRASTTPPNGEVVLIGNGFDRGTATDSDDPSVWLAPPDPPDPAVGGYLLGPARTLRWGTNRVEGIWPGDPFDTVALFTIFDEGMPRATADESQAVPGDSGGALFAKQGPDWELAGILYIAGSYPGQLPGNVLYGNASGAADLSFYRDEILRVTALPEPAVLLQLGAGTGWLVALRQRGRGAG
jgi:hypothetical protein